MNTYAWMLLASLPLLPVVACAADPPAKDPVAQDIDACKRQDQQQGKPASTIACAVKVVFQSRVRRNNRTEPVDMTVSSPPMITDDTGTPGPGDWEVDLGTQDAFAGGERRFVLPSITINHGTGDRLQMSYQVPYAFISQTSSDNDPVHQSAQGFGESIFGVKYRFYDDKDRGLSFAVNPQFEVRTPGSDRLVSGNDTGFILPVMMTREFQDASISADAGVEAAAGEQHYFASFGAGKRLTDNVAVLAEIAGNDLNSPASKHVLVNLGLRRKINATQQISGAIGHDLFAGSAEHELTYLGFYYQKVFGK